MSDQELQTILGTGNSPLIDMSQITDLLSIIIIPSIVLTLILCVYAITMSIVRIRSQKATIDMQKDIKAIRELLELHYRPPVPVQNPAPVDIKQEKTA